jgi:methionine sulfoxide reductase heme-binding subunit
LRLGANRPFLSTAGPPPAIEPPPASVPTPGPSAPSLGPGRTAADLAPGPSAASLGPGRAAADLALRFLEKRLRSKLFVWTLIVLPGLWPAWPLILQPDASAQSDPLKFILHHWGLVACLLLAVVLTFTPLRVLWPRAGLTQALNRHRRLVGVSAFAYAGLHFTVQVLYVYDGGFGTLVKELQKTFQLTGLIALVILLILAITSLHAFVRRLGARTWKALHRLAYPAAALVAYHQAAARKLFPLQVVWIFGPLVLLELARLWKQRKSTR